MPIPNVVRYTTSPLTGVLRKGNFYLGAADRDYGPSNVTGYYNGVTSSTYTTYVWDGSEIRYNIPTSDSDLNSFLSSRAGLNFSGLTESLLWSVTQSDIMISNRTYENIVTDSLVLNYDAGFIPSYPRSGTTWYNLNESNNGTLLNGIIFDSNTNYQLNLDGVDDYIDLGTFSAIDFSAGMTIEVIVKFSLLSGQFWERFLDMRNLLGLGTTISFGRNTSSTNIFFQSRNAAGVETQRRYISTTNPIQLNQIAMYTVTVGPGTPGVTASSVALFKNGSVLSATFSDGIPRLPSTTSRNQCWIGRSPFDVPRLNGSIYLIRVYNRELTSAEVLSNFNAQKVRYGL